MRVVGALEGEEISQFNELLLKRSYSTLYSDWFKFNLQVALRVTDSLSLKYSDIKDGRITIREGKTKKLRTIVLNDAAKKVVESRKLRFPDHEFLFQNEKTGKPVTRSAVSKVMKRASDEMGSHMPINTHSARKTKGRSLWENGVPLEKIAHFLNHSNPVVTMRYLGLNEKDNEDCFNMTVKV